MKRSSQYVTGSQEYGSSRLHPRFPVLRPRLSTYRHRKRKTYDNRDIAHTYVNKQAMTFSDTPLVWDRSDTIWYTIWETLRDAGWRLYQSATGTGRRQFIGYAHGVDNTLELMAV